ncbi:hypothetical protein [Paraliomyxa miuraensis]|uniref:hypothetical protein n=1 Tax=Paraliomyxa miuraensis TaxID=376150 RepID=UPI0022560A8D|nr:hypothetical protein [Paraliomyxa miuraensis]MCX4242623.1 hypothetical protein [Paraliomyxa miuraensis]
MLVSCLGCKSTPPLFTEIGDAVDRGAQKVVGVFDGRSLPPPQESEEEAVSRAREAYEAGKLAYQTARYLDALDHFLESFSAAEEIEDAELKAQIQSSLYYNLGSTHLRAFELDDDRTHLVQAKALLQNYLGSTPEPTEEEREQALALMDTADQKLAETAPRAEGAVVE